MAVFGFGTGGDPGDPNRLPVLGWSSKQGKIIDHQTHLNFAVMSAGSTRPKLHSEIHVSYSNQASLTTVFFQMVPLWFSSPSSKKWTGVVPPWKRAGIFFQMSRLLDIFPYNPTIHLFFEGVDLCTILRGKNLTKIWCLIWVLGLYTTLVFNGQGLLLEGSNSKIEDKQVLGPYMCIITRS